MTNNDLDVKEEKKLEKNLGFDSFFVTRCRLLSSLTLCFLTDQLNLLFLMTRPRSVDFRNCPLCIVKNRYVSLEIVPSESSCPSKLSHLIISLSFVAS